MKAQKAEFQIHKIRETIAAFDPNLAEEFKLLYDRSIDFGGHPNPYGVFSAMDIDKEDGKVTSITAFALTADVRILASAMNSVAKVGLTSLYIFQHIFKERFELLGIRAEMDALRKMGL